MVLRSLREAERLRGETEEMLLSWQHPGFQVHATEPVLADDKERQEHLARYITRAPLRLDAVKFTGERVRVQAALPTTSASASRRPLKSAEVSDGPAESSLPQPARREKKRTSAVRLTRAERRIVATPDQGGVRRNSRHPQESAGMG